MKKKLMKSLLVFGVVLVNVTSCSKEDAQPTTVDPTIGQWQQSAGTAGLNMQSLLTNGNYNFAGGQTGAYLSTDTAANYTAANSGNDAVGPTRGFTKTIPLFILVPVKAFIEVQIMVLPGFQKAPDYQICGAAGF
ncbi:MAG: hypothetical protein IPP42_19880 [Saprospiraceae bacterium]|nr:hypothetical protein [Saprospiraceae bacterium]